MTGTREMWLVAVIDRRHLPYQLQWLERRCVETWMPTVTETRVHKRKKFKYTVDIHLWPGYLFVKADDFAACAEFCRVNGVRGFLGSKEPEPISDGIIRDLKVRVADAVSKEEAVMALMPFVQGQEVQVNAYGSVVYGNIVRQEDGKATVRVSDKVEITRPYEDISPRGEKAS